MREIQRVIKYCAVAFAIFLIINIFSSIFYGIISLSSIFDSENEISEVKSFEVSEYASILNIDIKSTNLTIKNGNSLNVETDNKFINIKQDNNRIHIEESEVNWFNNTESNLVIYVPNDFIFDYVEIEVGAGKVNIDNFNIDKLNLELGAGKVNINNLYVNNNAFINGGAGEISIKTSVINNLDLDLGVGKTILNAKLKGLSEINSGIGKVDIGLIGTINDYKINVNKGIGEIIVEQKNIANGSYGSGPNVINIDGGIGQINVLLDN